MASQMSLVLCLLLFVSQGLAAQEWRSAVGRSLLQFSVSTPTADESIAEAIDALEPTPVFAAMESGRFGGGGGPPSSPPPPDDDFVENIARGVAEDFATDIATSTVNFLTRLDSNGDDACENIFVSGRIFARAAGRALVDKLSAASPFVSFENRGAAVSALISATESAFDDTIDAECGDDFELPIELAKLQDSLFAPYFPVVLEAFKSVAAQRTCSIKVENGAGITTSCD